MNGDQVVMMLRDHHIKIPINRNAANLPVVFKSFVSSKEKRLIGPQMLSGLAHTRLSQLDFFGDLATTNDLRASNVERGSLEHEFEHYSNFCGPCVGSSSNENLSNAQRELLLWHWKLGISMYRIQRLMSDRVFEEPSGKRTVLPPVLKPKFPSARNCKVPKCASCLLARAKKRGPGVKEAKAVPGKEGALARDRYEVGDFISTDQFVVKTPGRLPSGYGREASDRRFHGGTIFNDAASGSIWVENQICLGANETVMGKQHFEQWLWDQAAAEVSHYHGDNGIFTAEEYKKVCDNKGQTQSFSGVGAQHQNAHAERAIPFFHGAFFFALVGQERR